MKLEACPEVDLLGSHLLGKVSGRQAEAIDQHLETCHTCLQTARELHVHDEVLDVLQYDRPKLQGDDGVVCDLIERAKQMRSLAETLQSEVTVIEDRKDGQSAVAKHFDPQDIDFLSAPKQPDEIGWLGGYRVLDVLGVGGMGVVFRAEDPKLARQVALKAMKPDIAASQSAKERFLNEAKATAAIEHDHIITIHQVGEDRGIPFIAMPYLRGESLQTRLEREKQFDQREVARLGRQIAAGLAAAHERGLIHRDIKPDNIWLDSKQGRVKIVDFGLVRSTSEETGLTQTGMVVGTPKYMSPEQAGCESVDHRCDLFSLGSVLYHLLTGRPAFAGPNLTATLMAVAQADPSPIGQLVPELHPELAKLITRLLAKNRDDRPASAAKVVRILSDIERQLDASASQCAETVEHPTLPAVSAESPATTVARSGSNRRMLVVLAACVILAPLAYPAVMSIFKIATDKGTLVIELENATASEVLIDGKRIEFEIADGGKKLLVKVDAGQRTLTLRTADGVELSTSVDEKPVMIDARKQRSIKAWLEPAVVAKQDDSPSSAGQNWALEFDGKDDYVDIPRLKYDGSHSLTIEAYVVPRATPRRMGIVTLGTATSNDIGIQLATYIDGTWLMTGYYADRPRFAIGQAPFVRGQPRHVAGVWTSNKLHLYVDGCLVGTKEVTEQLIATDAFFSIGRFSNTNRASLFEGEIDEIRISKTTRYTENFKPQKRFENDEHTLALYHFDEASGDVLKDSSGNGHHGKIVGAKWVRVEGDLQVIEASAAEGTAHSELNDDSPVSAPVP